MHRFRTIVACGSMLILLGGCNLTACSITECEASFAEGAPASAAVAAPAVVTTPAVVAEPAVAAPTAVVAEPALVSPATTATVQDAADVKYYRSDEPLRMGIEHFNRGHFGIAERYFRDAVEKAPKDPTAWIGLAAACDRIARFDLADRAYRMAIRLVGETTEILNNQGYSYMLRGDLGAARRKFLKAYQREPNNPTIANNLQLLNASYTFIQRNPN
jgi:Flp pilus assembly protein TadD